MGLPDSQLPSQEPMVARQPLSQHLTASSQPRQPRELSQRTATSLVSNNNRTHTVLRRRLEPLVVMPLGMGTNNDVSSVQIHRVTLRFDCIGARNVVQPHNYDSLLAWSSEYKQ